VEVSSSPAADAEHTGERHHDEGRLMNTTTITTKAQAIRWAIFSAVAVGMTGLGLGVAHANPPEQDQPCSLRHASMRDADGHMMKCDRTVNGTHGLVWQYPPGS
jgi:hypothetical protein